MKWRQIVLAIILGTMVGTIVTYLKFEERVSKAEQHFSSLSTMISQTLEQVGKLKTIPDHPVSQEEVEEIYEKLKTTVAASMQVSAQQDAKLANQIEQTHQLVSTELNQLKNALTQSLQTQTHTLKMQVEATHKTIDTLLETIRHKEAIINQLASAGTVMAYVGPLDTQAQTHLYQGRWLVCDGRSLSASEYPDLYQAIRNVYGGHAPDTFNLPDFRGVFLRGLDLGKQRDEGRQLGSFQEDTNQAHFHEGRTVQGEGVHEHQGVTEVSGKHRHLLEARGYWFTSKVRNERAAMTNSVDDNQEYWTSSDGEHAHEFKIKPSGIHEHTVKVDVRGGIESRPKNYPVIYIIRF